MKLFYCTALLTFLFSNHLHAFTSKPLAESKNTPSSISPKDTLSAWNEEERELIERMQATSKTIPLTYNEKVKYFIDKYTSANYRPYMSRLLGLSKHYFAVYEKVFKDMQIPDEVKYLSLVESSLDPHLVSRSGAVGPWQFIYTTARLYDLDMNAHIDERKDIYTATYAVSKYLKEAYDMFNDWTLALASYNCGRGAMQRALARTGPESPTFWDVAPYLPQETQNYIPKYIAMTYVLSNAAYYAIEPAETELDYTAKMVMVDKVVDLRHIAKAINMDLKQLKHYNPAYKKSVVPGSVEKPKRLFLPVTPNVNDSLLYLALNAPSSLTLEYREEEEVMVAEARKTYRVKKGETLTSIARKFGVTVQDLKAWNNLSNKSIIAGRQLVVFKPVSTTLAKNTSSRNKTSAPKSRTAYYTVKKGDSLDKIARKYDGITVEKIKKDNGLKGNLIKPGMRLKIRKD